jgi:hypothetical protein
MEKAINMGYGRGVFQIDLDFLVEVAVQCWQDLATLIRMAACLQGPLEHGGAPLLQVSQLSDARQKALHKYGR